MALLIAAKQTYEKIMKYNWFFKLNNEKIVKITFNEEHFTHLIFGTKVNEGLGKYKGKNGYLEIQSKVFPEIEIEIKSNPIIGKELSNIKNRIKYFPELINILEKPDYFFYDIKKVKAQNSNEVRANFAIIQLNNNSETDKKFRTTFFIRENKSNIGEYFGVSCVVDNSSFKHTCNQERIEVIDYWKEEREKI